MLGGSLATSLTTQHFRDIQYPRSSRHGVTTPLWKSAQYAGVQDCAIEIVSNAWGKGPGLSKIEAETVGELAPHVMARAQLLAVVQDAMVVALSN